MKSIFNVPSMKCQHCVKSIDSALKGINGVKEVIIDLDTKKVSVTYEDSVTETNLINAIEDEGFDVE